MLRSFPILLGFTCFSIFFDIELRAQPSTADWKTSKAFQEACNKRFSTFRQNEPLHRFVSSIGSSQQIAIFLDRRLDCSREIDFSADELSPLAVLFEFGQQIAAAPCQIGDVVYFGPRNDAALIGFLEKRLRKQISDLPKTQQRAWLKKQELSWPRLAVPAEILASLARQNSIELVGLDSIEHDLWRAGSWPRLSLYEHLLLLTVGFGRTVEILEDGRSAKIVDLPLLESYELAYRTKSPKKLEMEIKERLGGVDISRSKRSISVRVNGDEHSKIAGMVANANMSSRKSADAELRVSLKVEEAQIGSVLKSVAKQLKVEFSFDESAASLLQNRVSFDLIDVSYDTLIRTALKDTRLKYELTAERLIIRSKTDENR